MISEESVKKLAKVLRFIMPVQSVGETLWICDILAEHSARNVLEIGTGWSTVTWELLLEPEVFIVTVDIRPGLLQSIKHWVHPEHIRLIQADSRDLETVEKVKGYFAYGMVDFLFIDGEHAYEFVKSDYVKYSPFVKKGGIIALHDVIMQGPGRVLKEAEDQGLTTEKFGEACGIGLIFK